MNKMPLDELEICIQLLQVTIPELKKASYEELKKAVEKEFNTEVNIHDIYLLYEPNVEQIQEDMEVYYGSMFNISRNEQYY